MKKKRKLGRKLLSFLLTLAMVVGMMPGMGLTAYAEGGGKYREYAWNEISKTLSYEDKDIPVGVTELATDTVSWTEGGWYIVPEEGVTISNRITVTGTANLILRDGATLTASKGITVNSGNTINIYAQSEGTGVLSAGNTDNAAGIGGGARYQSGGIVNIHGGKITATGGYGAAGIGGALQGGNGEVNIYGGNVTAQGSNFAAGIGGYSGKSGGTVSIYGGTVNASGSINGVGIGIGGTEPGSCIVNIYGGDVTASSGKQSGIQGTVTIDGGTVTANGGTYDSNLSGFSGTTVAYNGISGTVTINGGTVSATGGNVTGEITNYGGNIYACNGIGGTVTINGGAVTATGGSHTGDFGNYGGTTVKEKGFGGSLTLGTGMYLYGGTSANPESDLSNYRADAGDYTGDRYVYMTVNNVVPHIHSFTYTADGATVTATCGAEGCDLTSNPTLTIVAPTLTTYGQTGEGISEKATLDGLDAFKSATDLTVAASDIKYYGVEEYEIEGHTYKKQGDELAQVPTAAGEYVAGLTLSNVKTSETETGDVIARVWYTIAPASISSVTVTDITAPVATEALDTEAATSTANVTLGTVTWNPTTTPAAYATQYTANVIATAAANYAFADTATATVNGQAATVTKNDDGTLSVAYTFEKTALTPVTITPANKEADWSADGIAIPVDGMFTITEGAGAATYTVTNGTGEGTFAEGELTVTKCGTFTVKVSTAATETYAAGAETTATLTVNKVAAVAATVTANSRTYDGTEKPLVTVTGEAAGGEMQYALGTDATTAPAENLYTTSIPTAANAGTYYVWYKVAGDGNHKDYVATSPVSVKIEQATVNLTWENTEFTYDGTDKLPTAEITAGIVENDDCKVEVSGKQTDVNTGDGTYTATAQLKGADSANYKIAEADKTKTFTINAKAMAVTVDGVNVTYDGKEHKITVNVTDPADATITYKKAGDTEYSATNPTFKDAGEYEVSYKVAKANYTEFTGRATVKINKKAVVVSGITAENKEYDGTTNATLVCSSATINGIAEGDDLIVTAAGSFEDANAGEGKKVTISGLTLGGASVKNYELAATGNQTETTADITKKAVVVTPYADQSKIYGGADPTFTYNATGLVGDEELSGALERTAGGAVGEYAYTIGTLDSENSNYSITISKTSPKFEIKAKEIEIEWADTELTYNGKEQTPEASIKNKTEVLVGDDEVNITVSGQKKDVNTADTNYTATASVDNKNYTLKESTDSTAFTIKKAVLTVTADAKTITYGDKEAELTYKVTGLVECDAEDKVLTGDIAREAGTDAGTYKITQGTLKANDNYNISFTGADYVIKKATQAAPTEKFTSTKATDNTSSDAKISGFDKAKAYQYSSDAGKTWNDVTGKTEITDKAGTYQIRYAGDKNHEPGATADVTVSAKASQNKPAGLDDIEVSKEGAKDGTVTGVNDTMEYSLDGGKTWTAVTKGATKIENLASGKVLVRIKGTDDKNPSESVEVMVGVKKVDVDTLAINAGFKVTQSGSKITVKWGKVESATGYEVYVAYCGKQFSKTPAKRTTTKTSAVVTKVGGKKINLKKNFKVYVVAVKKDSDNITTLAKTITGHIVGRKNTKYTNVKSITLKTKALSIAVGKTSKIKAKIVLENKKKKQLGNGHAAEFRYASSDENIATVDKTGKVKGIAKGTCTIYVYARNGYAKTVKVTVK